MLLGELGLADSLEEEEPDYEEEKGDAKNWSITLDGGSPMETSRCSTRMKNKQKKRSYFFCSTQT